MSPDEGVFFWGKWDKLPFWKSQEKNKNRRVHDFCVKKQRAKTEWNKPTNKLRTTHSADICSDCLFSMLFFFIIILFSYFCHLLCLLSFSFFLLLFIFMLIFVFYSSSTFCSFVVCSCLSCAPSFFVILLVCPVLFPLYVILHYHFVLSLFECWCMIFFLLFLPLFFSTVFFIVFFVFVFF